MLIEESMSTKLRVFTNGNHRCGTLRPTVVPISTVAATCCLTLLFLHPGGGWQVAIQGVGVVQNRNEEILSSVSPAMGFTITIGQSVHELSYLMPVLFTYRHLKNRIFKTHR